MQLGTRKVLDHSFSALGVISILLMAVSVVIVLAPIVYKGSRAFVFKGTIEHRKLLLSVFGRGDQDAADRDEEAARAARKPVYDMLARARDEAKGLSGRRRREMRDSLDELDEAVRKLFGPNPNEPTPVMMRNQYGQTRWDRAQVKLHELMFVEEWDYSDPTAMGKKVFVPRARQFEGTVIEKEGFFSYVEEHLEETLIPRWTFYWGFITDRSFDAHFFGGVWPEFIGTIYLTIGAMLFAVPLGLIAAIYLVEYAGQGALITTIRVCISTLAGVPSIVFGLFGLAFLINTIHVSGSKSTVAGAPTLALLILPTVIRASEEAIRAVPQTYREAALSLGAGKWHTIITVILPAALPGVLTGIVISMGRAAGETAPIIFTAAVSVGQPLKLMETFSQPTPALPWNIYNLCTEHEAVDEIRHVQFGMVLVLVSVVLILNGIAVVARARISKKLHG